ncbi:MAG: helicase-related protein, partial [Candidatus Roizmanbacteria bacterium]
MAEKLSIYKQLPEIVEMIRKNLVTWVIVDTGCGKSAGIPWALIRDGAFVTCTQPTIPAATSLFEFQKKLSPKHTIGFAAEGEKKYKHDTQCVYATAGHIRKVMIGMFEEGIANPQLWASFAKQRILMVDEIHTGTKDNSIIIDLWMEARRQKVAVPRLVLSTATDFGLQPLMAKLQGDTFRSDFRHFKVETRYHNRSFRAPDEERAFPAAAQAAIDLLLELKSHIIVFCSGSSEVEDMVEELNKMLSWQAIGEPNGPLDFRNKKVQVLPCYSQCKREEIDLAISDVRGSDIIKIVVGTNLLESSLTIPDAIGVVDMMSEKRADMIGKRFHLATTYISKNSADQRKGRTGRTIKGSVCYRMCTQEEYEKFEEFRPLEIRRTPISDVVIELLTCGLDPVKVISELDMVKLETAKRVLIETGCITYDTTEGKASVVAKVTSVGKFVSCVPMDVRNAASLFYYLKGLPEEENIFWALVAFVMTDLYGPSPFWFPRKEKHEKTNMYHMRLRYYIEEHFEKYLGQNSLETMVNMFKDCMDTYAKDDLYTPPWMIKEYCNDNSCNNKKLREIIMQLRRMQKVMQNMEIPFNYQYYETEGNEAVTDIMPGVIKALTRGYQGSLLMNLPTQHGYGLASDGMMVKLDTIKNISDPKSTSLQMPFFIPLSEIQFQTPGG